jgi:hypothetical protein
MGQMAQYSESTVVLSTERAAWRAKSFTRPVLQSARLVIGKNRNAGYFRLINPVWTYRWRLS